MEVEIKVDKECKETRIVIITSEVTEEVNRLAKVIMDVQPQFITGLFNDSVYIIEPEMIIRVFSSNQKVYVQTREKEYIVRMRLYELEQRLDKMSFVRISNSEIINIKEVLNFDFSFKGTICVKLSTGISTYVSRRYVSKIKEILGM